jgi:hypothetical protein
MHGLGGLMLFSADGIEFRAAVCAMVMNEK